MKAIGLDNRYSRTGKVQFICIHPKYRNRNIYCVPVYDAALNDYRYYPSDCNDEDAPKLAKKYFPDPSEQVFVKHNQVLDKSNDRDYALYLLLLTQEPLIVDSHDKLIPGQSIGYIYDAEYEASSKVSKMSHKYELISKVHQMSIENQKRLAYFLGYDPNKMTLQVMMATIYDKVENEPKVVNEFFTDPDVELKTLFNIMRKDGIVTKRNNAFYFENIYLGVGVGEVINFLKQDNNSDLLSSMRRLVRNPLAYIREKEKENDTEQTYGLKEDDRVNVANEPKNSSRGRKSS